jgi:hypothetical protein
MLALERHLYGKPSHRDNLNQIIKKTIYFLWFFNLVLMILIVFIIFFYGIKAIKGLFGYKGSKKIND